MYLYDAITSCTFYNAFNYKNRASRSEFWQFVVFWLFCSSCLFLTSVVCDINTVSLCVIILYGMWILVVATIRRLHDVDKRGWLLMPLFLAIIHLLDTILYAGPENKLNYLVMDTLILSFFSINLLITLSKLGSNEDNRFGVPRSIIIDSSNINQYKIENNVLTVIKPNPYKKFRK